MFARLIQEDSLLAIMICQKNTSDPLNDACELYLASQL
jgi:hypothetical protein